jgi:hypothetical protein
MEEQACAICGWFANGLSKQLSKRLSKELSTCSAGNLRRKFRTHS